MTDINDLVQEFLTSSNGVVGASLIAMRRLFGILRVCFDIISFFVTAIDLAVQKLKNPYYFSWHYRDQSPDDQISLEDKFSILFDGYRQMIDQSFSKSKDLGDMLRFLPGVVVQKSLSKQGMADLYRVKPIFLGRLIKSFELRRSSSRDKSGYYKMDNYLSGFLQDRDRSQLLYCDPVLQHISICRRIFSLLYQSNVFDDQL